MLLQEMSGQSFTSTAEFEIVRYIKEKLCFVAQDYDKELGMAEYSSENHRAYTLSDTF